MAGLPPPNIEYTYQVNPECPDNTPSSTPQTLALPQIATCMLWQMNVRVPPGHAGYTGIALVDSGSWAIPQATTGGQWIIGDDDYYEFPYNQQVGANVQLWFYNTSTDFEHGWIVYFLYTPMSALSTDAGVIVTPDVADWAQTIEGTTGG